MKRLFSVLFLLLLLVLAGCADDGDDGVNGADGADGADAVTTGTLSGTVLDAAGTPIEGATISTNPESTTTTTDGEGAFTLADIPLGSYTVTASLPDGGSTSLDSGVAGGGVTSINLTLAGEGSGSTAPATIAGMVQDTNEDPIYGATVSVEGQDVTATTAVDGTFSLYDVTPGYVYLNVQSPADDYLAGGNREAINAEGGSSVEDIQITLSGRPSESATYLGMEACKVCHQDQWPEIFAAYDGSPEAVAHSRFVNEDTSHMVYPDMWPGYDEKVVPLDPDRNELEAQSPVTGDPVNLVNVVLCRETADEAGERYTPVGNGDQFLFKFYNTGGLTATELTCSTYDPVTDPLSEKATWIPVAATIGGEGNWGEGYDDPNHTTPDNHPNFGEGKQRYMARIQDVPYVVQWNQDHGIDRTGQKQDYIAYLPAFIMQDGTAAVLPNDEDNLALAEGEFSAPTFYKKSPSAWANPYNTLSRNCAGCHATGLSIETQDFGLDTDHPYKEIVTDWDYKDLNVTCERCHGPASEHFTDKTKLIMPQYLTNQAANETCGQCHSNHDGRSEVPEGIYKPAYDERTKDTLGNGFFLPGLYSLESFFYKFNTPMDIEPGTLSYPWQTGSFLSWPDQTHARVHSQEYLEMTRSVHYNNSSQKLACFDCHNAHSLNGGPASLVANDYDFKNVAYGNNALCLSCHATQGPFENISTADVAALQLDAGRTVTKDGEDVVVAVNDRALSRDRIAKAVAEHMQVGAGMGGALYTPEDPEMPVGNCASCHMAKISKLQDIDVDSFWHLALDKDGNSAVAEGNVPSHVFDIVWPGQSAVLKSAATHDYDIMPNSCSKCHEFARLSGDMD